MNTEETSIMFVKRTTPTKQLGTAIVRKHEENPEEPVILRGIGAGSITQCVYGTIIARTVLEDQGKTVAVEMCYTDVINTSNTRHQKPKITAVEFKVVVNGKNPPNN